MTVRTIPSESVENIEIGVQVSADPTGGAVEVGFSDTDDAPTTWHAGTWEPDQRVILIGSGYAKAWVAVFLIGTGTLDLSEGTYLPWIRVTDGAETVVRKTPDRLVIT